MQLKSRKEVRFYLECVCVVIASLNFAEGSVCWLSIPAYMYTVWFLYAPVLSKVYVVLK